MTSQGSGNQQTTRWSWFSNMRMERKLLLIFLVIITVPLALIGYISYNNYANQLNTAVYYQNLSRHKDWLKHGSSFS
ncbi:CHASE3 domain-containing protein [Paenibacillus gansuensis]|uniref:Uncharacterized protein n=1 Tax=Paenibacillus gansuensis TaxID=306542 RepID=A0ABW5P8Y2_9BACL